MLIRGPVGMPGAGLPLGFGVVLTGGRGGASTGIYLPSSGMDDPFRCHIGTLRIRIKDLELSIKLFMLYSFYFLLLKVPTWHTQQSFSKNTFATAFQSMRIALRAKANYGYFTLLKWQKPYGEEKILEKAWACTQCILQSDGRRTRRFCFIYNNSFNINIPSPTYGITANTFP